MDIRLSFFELVFASYVIVFSYVDRIVSYFVVFFRVKSVWRAIINGFISVSGSI